MFNVIEWLEQTNQQGVKRGERIAFLVVSNGGFAVHSWGVITTVNSIQNGLDEGQAFELMETSAFINGLEAAGVNVKAHLFPYIEAYQDKVDAATSTVHG